VELSSDIWTELDGAGRTWWCAAGRNRRASTSATLSALN